MTGNRPNVVLVSIDSLRADHCGYLGDDRGLTPTLDAMARRGVAFENAVAPGPQTFSSMPVAFTGEFRAADSLDRHPGESNWQRRLAAVSTHLDHHPPIQERLREAGYATVGFSPNPWTSEASGFDRGFDRFVDISAAERDGRLADLVDRLPGVDPDAKPVELALNVVTGQSFFAGWESFYDDLVATCRDLPEPFFLWVFLMDSHIPYLTGRAHREENSLPGMYYGVLRSERAMRGKTDSLPDRVRKRLLRSYRDSVRAVDAFLYELRSDLADRDPVYVVHADHGESFGEHGHYGHHHRQVYEENVHVPFVVEGAGVERTVADPVSLSRIDDAIRTLAAGERLDPSALTDPFVVTTSECGTHRAVRGQRFKFVESEGREALYDLQVDPGETEDVATRHPSFDRELRGILDRFDRQRAEMGRLRRAARAVGLDGRIPAGPGDGDVNEVSQR